jgi:predicted RNA methylase
MLRQVSNRRARRLERALDLELGVDTAGGMTQGAILAETGIDSEIERYEPVSANIFASITACLPDDLSMFSFIDVGSGKGRALFLAAPLGFKEIIGIELSPTLHQIAAKNLKKMKSGHCAAFRLLNMDARFFLFPPGPTVVFLANPFGERIMREVISNLELAHGNNECPVFLLYYCPKQLKVLEESGKWEEIDRGGWNQEIGRVWRVFKLSRDDAVRRHLAAVESAEISTLQCAYRPAAETTPSSKPRSKPSEGEPV